MPGRCGYCYVNYFYVNISNNANGFKSQSSAVIFSELLHVFLLTYSLLLICNP